VLFRSAGGYEYGEQWAIGSASGGVTAGPGGAAAASLAYALNEVDAGGTYWSRGRVTHTHYANPAWPAGRAEARRLAAARRDVLERIVVRVVVVVVEAARPPAPLAAVARARRHPSASTYAPLSSMPGHRPGSPRGSKMGGAPFEAHAYGKA
jgi:hypothetical protein